MASNNASHPSRGQPAKQENIMNRAKNTATVRAAVKAIYEAARVTKNGEVHVKGVMPNTNKTGWYLLGFVGQPELDAKIWDEDGNLRDA